MIEIIGMPSKKSCPGGDIGTYRREGVKKSPTTPPSQPHHHHLHHHLSAFDFVTINSPLEKSNLSQLLDINRDQLSLIASFKCYSLVCLWF